ncbi:hypothetical protein BBJ28_00003191 [Nothophytophthora sp. Chile5]|nr:hypothetical protein BBJ28_00003191 [Nothophytophthora sp. Chile5]
MPVIHDRYRVVSELSETLYGWVYACEDLQCGVGSVLPSTSVAAVVIKQISLDCAASLRRAQPAHNHVPDDPLREKEMGELIRSTGGHPNLVQYHDAFVEQETMYLVMEYCAGGDLYDYLSTRRQRMLSCLNALSVLSQVASGVAFLHEHGIAHRDISLENIMLHRGRCKLGDFGLATRETDAGGRRVGKKYYMAPEVVAGSTYDPKAADVWSLGIVLFIMVTGSPLIPLACMSVKAFRTLKQAGPRAILASWGMAHIMSESAQHLLAGMLEVNARKRLTIQQVLGHVALSEWLDVATASA